VIEIALNLIDIEDGVVLEDTEPHFLFLTGVRINLGFVNGLEEHD